MHKTRILVVDDELGIIKFLRANLEGRGYKVFAAMDGAEALQTFETELPDLVILDIMMPRLNGFEVCRQLRKTVDIPILIIGADAGAEVWAKVAEVGADFYLVKPFSYMELIARVKALLRRYEWNGN